MHINKLPFCAIISFALCAPAIAAKLGAPIAAFKSEKETISYAVGASVAMQGVTVGYTWRKLEANAVLGTLTDSDFGLGGTDEKGGQVFASYDVSKLLGFKVTWAAVQQGHDAGKTQNADRIQLDVQLKY